MSAFEQILIKTIRQLQPGRATEVLDFARWLEAQPTLDELLHEDVTPDELEQEEKAWEQAYLANREEFRAMARQALDDLDAGETLEMVIENGKLAAR